MSESLDLSPDIERDIMSLCFKDSQFFLDIHEYLKAEHLISDSAVMVWKTLQFFFHEWHSVPKPDIIMNLVRKHWNVDLGDCYIRSEVLEKEFLIYETIKRIRMQELRRFILNAADEAEKDLPNYESMEMDLQKILAIQPMSNLGMVYFDLDERFERINSIRQKRTPTSIKVIDDALGGGLASKELVAIGAPPGAGKSYLLCISGAHMVVRGKKNVVHYSMEMSEERVALRYDMATLKLSSSGILDDIEGVKKRLRNIKGVLNNNLIIKEFPQRSASVGTLRTHIHKMREQKNFVPDVIIVDYGDIMKPAKHYNSKYEEQGAIFSELRGLAQEFDVPILTATQTNRGSVTKEIVGMEDLGDSFDKARTVDALFTMVQKPEEREEGLFKIYEAKNRNGKAGRLHGYRIDYETAQLESLGEVDLSDE
jgi:replicative DNA helicase